MLKTIFQMKKKEAAGCCMQKRSGCDIQKLQEGLWLFLQDVQKKKQLISLFKTAHIVLITVNCFLIN